MVIDTELPIGYKRVLGFTCNNNAIWEITDFHLRGSDTVFISFLLTGACNVFGCYQNASASDNYDLYAATTVNSYYLRYGSGKYLSTFAGDDLNKRFDCVFTPTGTQGMPVDSEWEEAEFEAANDLMIGATSPTSSSAKLKGNLYGSFIVKNNGVERLHLVPCERLSDNVLGWYDLVGETFHGPYSTYTGAVSMGYDHSHEIAVTDFKAAESDLTAVANAIRAKSGGSAALVFPAGFVDAIDAIPTGGGGMTIDQFVDHNYPQGAIETSATVIPTQTFRERKGITSLSAPNCTQLGGYGCYQCTELVTVSFPELTNFLASNIFDGCTKLIGFVGPALTGGNTNATFARCTSFEYFDVGPNLANMATGNTFQNSTNLTTVVLRRTAGVVAIAASTFNGTPFASGGTGGTIYIPKVLYDHLGDGTALDYKAATNWSTIDGYGTITWAKIEGSIYETKYADGTTIPTT